jgi:hypothetical protein
MKPNNFRNKFLIALFFCLLVLGAIVLGFNLIIKYSSRIFVLNKLVQNINFENENSLKTKLLLDDNIKNFDNLKSHTIDKEDEVPMVVGEIESYADDLNIPIKINSINVVNLNKKRDSDSENPEASPALGQILKIEIQSNGDFNSLVKLLKLFENSNYVISVDKYHLRQVISSGYNAGSGDLVFNEINPNSQINLDQTKIWLLSASLSITTNIK